MASLNDVNQYGQNGWADLYQDGSGVTDSESSSQSRSGASIAPGLVGSVAGFGLNAAGLPGNTGASLASQATTGSFDVGRTGLAVAKDVVSMAAPQFSGIIGAGLNAGYAGVMGGPKAAAQSAAQSAASFAGFALGGPLGAIAGSVLGSMAIGSFNDGAIGDALGSRSRESARDRAESMGYSRSQTADGAASDRAGDFGNSGYGGISPGLGSRGYGLDPGLSDMSGKYGNVSLGEASFGGYNDGGFGDHGGEGNGGSDPGGDGGHGSRGGGNEGNSSPGGIGGY